MKKTTVIMFAALIAGVTVFEGCKKYDEGPGLSLRSRKARIANTWEVEKYVVGSEDQTSSFNNINPDYKMQLDKDGKGEISYSAFGIQTTVEGTWELISDDEELQTKFGNNTSTSKILKLKEKELWLVDEGDTNDPDDDIEIHLAPAE